MEKASKRIGRLWNDPVRTFQLVSLFRQAAPFLAAFFLAQSSMSLEHIGQIEWLFFVGYSLSFFWLTGFAQFILTDLAAPVNRSSIVFSGFFNGLVVLSILVALINLSIGYLDGIVAFSWYGWFSIWLLFSLSSGLLPYLLYLDNKNSLLHLYNLFYFLSYSAIFLIFGYWYPTPEGLFIALSAQGFLLFVLICLYLSGQVSLKMFKSVHISFPLRAVRLSLIALIGGASLVFDGYLVRWFFADEAIFAIFRYGAREFPLSLTMTAALSNAFIPILALGGVVSLHKFRARILNLMHLIFPVALLLMIFSNLLFELVYGPRFSESVFLFDLMLFLVAIRFIFPHTIMIAKQREQFLTRVAIMELLINVLASFVLMYFIGLPGIVIGTLIAYSFEKILLIIYLKRNFGFGLGEYLPKKLFLIYSLALFSLFVVKQFLGII